MTEKLRNLFSEERSAEAVVASLHGTPDPRLRVVMTSLVHHLHAFVKEVELSEAELAAAISFLTPAGPQVSQLFDILGVSMLVETINHRAGSTGTESTLLGPMHSVASPPRRLGDDIALDGKGVRCLLQGRVTGPDGQPVAGASVDVWQANEDGFYDLQQPDVQPELNLRGLFTTDADGRYYCLSVVPRHYPIPGDGPVGELLRLTGRHRYRPAHLHYIVTAPGYRAVTTNAFLASSDYLDSDVVFAVKESLVRDLVSEDDPDRATALGLPNPFPVLTFDVGLLREGPTRA